MLLPRSRDNRAPLQARLGSHLHHDGRDTPRWNHHDYGFPPIDLLAGVVELQPRSGRGERHLHAAPRGPVQRSTAAHPEQGSAATAAVGYGLRIGLQGVLAVLLAAVLLGPSGSP